MKIKLMGFMGKNHSWSTIHWALAREWKKMGHEVHLFSTDGIEHLPDDLKENLIGYKKFEDKEPNKKQSPIVGCMPDNDYDMQFSYTAMKNARAYLSDGSKNRFNMWCYEWINDEGKSVLPTGFATCYRFSDKLLVPTTYVKKYMMMASGIPEDRVVVVPHGVDVENFKKNTVIELPTKKSFKFLFNVTQTHLRKNIHGLLEAYGKAFTNDDDVCLILKTKDRKPRAPFEVSVGDEIKKFKKKFSNAPEVKIYNKFLTDISKLYRSIDCTVSLSFGEGFNMPLIESISAGKLVVAPDKGPHKDFLNTTNALFVKSKIKKANLKSIYWSPNPNSKWVVSDLDDAAEKLKEAYNIAHDRNKILELEKESVYNNYNWNKIAKDIIALCDNKS